jgi:hypothetical protein
MKKEKKKKIIIIIIIIIINNKNDQITCRHVLVVPTHDSGRGMNSN